MIMKTVTVTKREWHYDQPTQWRTELIHLIQLTGQMYGQMHNVYL